MQICPIVLFGIPPRPRISGAHVAVLVGKMPRQRSNCNYLENQTANHTNLYLFNTLSCVHQRSRDFLVPLLALARLASQWAPRTHGER